ncbi:unnamed protein product [Malus baccata var. baccata]
MQKKRWAALSALRKVLTCAICSIALVALFSVHVLVFPSSRVHDFSDPFKLPTQHDIKYQKLSAEQSWTLEIAPPHLLKAPLPSSSRKLEGSSGILETDKLWKRPSNRDFVPCVEPSPNYTSPRESRGYLLVHTNGGLNQMRAGICDMVAVARIINATLVIPELDKRSFWNDSSIFSDVFDEDHFINALANDVKIIKNLPKELATGIRAAKHFRSWSGIDYYQDEIAGLWEKYEVIRAAKSDSRLANNNLPLDIQKLRCRACYEALRFAPQIEAMGKLLVDRMRSFGPYIALHLRFEEDMLAFSGCTQDLSPDEAEELRIIRENTPYWKEKEINSTEQRSKGYCPLTPKEVGIFLTSLGYPLNTPIYLAAGKIYGGESHMAALRSRYPILLSKETLTSAEELEPFTNHASQMAALDYIVSVETLVRLIDKLEQGTLKEGKNLSNRVIEMHKKRQGSARKRKGPISGTKGTERFRSEEPFYRRSWRTLATVRTVLTCAVCSIALVALFFLQGPQLLRPRQAPHGDPLIRPISLFSLLDDTSRILDDKLWKIPPSPDFMQSPAESRGYFQVRTNGGLNQMRAGICDMVAVARIINATLLIPELDQRSFWKDSSNFSNVFDEDHFINALANDVKIVRKLPKELASGPRALKLFRSWGGMDYYQDEIASLWELYEVIRASKVDARLVNNNLPLDIQKLRCRAFYEAPRFTPEIEAMGKLLVDRMRSFGPYIALHLRFEKDMLAFSGCTQDLTPSEADELRIIRENTKTWRNKEINPIEQRSRGTLGYPPNTPIYIAAGKMYDDSHMADLLSRFPILKSKHWHQLRSLNLLPITSQMAVLDYIVSVESDVFIPTYLGHMAAAVEEKPLFRCLTNLSRELLRKAKPYQIQLFKCTGNAKRKTVNTIQGPTVIYPLPPQSALSPTLEQNLRQTVILSFPGQTVISTAAMAVSFLSTVPSFLPLPPATLNAPKYPILSVKIHCNKIEADAATENRFHRRDILKCVGATIGVEMLRSSGTFVQVAEAADLIQRRQRSEFLSSIKDTLFKAIKENRELIPSLQTLALNDAVTYDKASKSGGPNGSIRFSSEISRPENKGLAAALNLIEEAKKEIDSNSKGGPISYADLIQLAAQSATKQTFLAAAIRKCGGNEEKGNLLYTAYGSNGQWGLFERNFGRTDTEEPDPEGRVPQWDKASVQESKAKFSALGFGPRQLAVMSAFLGPDQIATETLLAADPEVFPWVQKYQRSRETVSETDYEVDMITTFTKLSTLGQQINYEAYTYPVQKMIIHDVLRNVLHNRR